MNRTQLRAAGVVIVLGAAASIGTLFVAGGRGHAATDQPGTRPPGTASAPGSPSGRVGISGPRGEGDIRADLFGGPGPAQIETRRPPIGSVPASTMAEATGTPGPPDPLADLVYAGSVTKDGEMVALLENRVTHQGWYVAEDDIWQGHRVLYVGPDSVSLSVNGVDRVIAKSDAFTLVPLSADAPGSAPQIAAAEAAAKAAAQYESAKIDSLVALKLDTAVVTDVDVLATAVGTLRDADIAADLILIASPAEAPQSAPAYTIEISD